MASNTKYLILYTFLASAGYIVYKSVPFGPVNTLLPYFARRAAENRVVLQGTRKEQELLQAELSRRFYRNKHDKNKNASAIN